MSLAWNAVFVLLCVEMVITMLLVLNLYTPIRKAVTKSLQKVFSSKAITNTSIVIMILLILLFIDAFRTQSRLTEELLNDDTLHDNAKELALRVRIFREQRNLYLSGGALFLGIAVYCIVRLYDEFDAERAILTQHSDISRKEIEELRKAGKAAVKEQKKKE